MGTILGQNRQESALQSPDPSQVLSITPPDHSARGHLGEDTGTTPTTLRAREPHTNALTSWRKGSASDSRSEGCVFESHRGQPWATLRTLSIASAFRDARAGLAEQWGVALAGPGRSEGPRAMSPRRIMASGRSGWLQG